MLTLELCIEIVMVYELARAECTHRYGRFRGEVWDLKCYLVAPMIGLPE